MKNNKLVIITPCYNEEKIIEYLIKQLTMIINIMIDDGFISLESKVLIEVKNRPLYQIEKTVNL